MNDTGEEIRDMLYRIWMDGRDGKDRYASIYAVVATLNDWHTRKLKEAVREARINELTNTAILAFGKGDMNYDRTIAAGELWEKMARRKRELEKEQPDER